MDNERHLTKYKYSSNKFVQERRDWTQRDESIQFIRRQSTYPIATSDRVRCTISRLFVERCHPPPPRLYLTREEEAKDRKSSADSQIGR